jgi:endonuclease/exonuclease/phosphatase (EEP) superfamily protein YafD
MGILAWTLALLFVLMNLLPLVRSDFWTFRLFEYPRFQKLVIGLACLVAILFLRPYIEDSFYFLFGIVLGCVVFLLMNIFPYTPVAKKEVIRVRAKANGLDIKIFTANVLQTNTNYQKLLQQIEQMDPDIVFLVETHKEWDVQMQQLEDRYPYTIKKPLDNTYGLLFFSRLPLRNSKVLFRVDKEVPSIETEAQLPGEQWIKIYGLHPKPPVPKESLYSTAKDKELMLVAFEAKKETKPCVVMGDLNDVAWSHVTKLFRKVSGLLDPRRGRGFYSTFSANNWIMRFPLDYIFCSSHFGLVTMRRMPHNGSDHFAMFIHLQYDDVLETVQEEPEADQEEIKDAKEKATETTPAE